jgi:hypothetical protein
MTESGEIPARVLKAIRKKAREDWEYDPEQMEAAIAEEKGCYLRFQNYDFGDATPYKDQMARYAIECDSWNSWENRLSYLEAEAEAFRELRRLKFKGVPGKIVASFVVEATERHPSSFTDRLDDVEHAATQYRYVREVRQTVSPIKRLLIEMEHMVGDRFYNPYTQNYGPGGVWEGEGRSYRYPLTTILNDEQKRKHRGTVHADVPDEELITGYYKVGTNELSIVRAMIDIVRLIECEYGVDLSDRNRKR